VVGAAVAEECDSGREVAVFWEEKEVSEGGGEGFYFLSEGDDGCVWRGGEEELIAEAEVDFCYFDGWVLAAEVVGEIGEEGADGALKEDDVLEGEKLVDMHWVGLLAEWGATA